MVRENSHQLWYQSHAPVRFTPEQKKAEKEARAEIKAAVMKELGINIGDASNMLTGNRFFKLSEAHDFFASLLHDETKKEDFKEIHLGMCSIVRVLNTQRRKVDTAKLHFLGNKIYMLMVKTFPWAAISTSLHCVLGHGWEVVEISGGKGLGAQSEEGLEGQNKYVRFYREHGAGKTSIEENFSDTFRHLWIGSSPLLGQLDQKSKVTRRVDTALGEVDALTESLFLEDGPE
jgi:hypothetical protein